jgi:pentatricopeptide repeat protein
MSLLLRSAAAAAIFLSSLIGFHTSGAQELPAPKASADEVYYDAIKARMLGNDRQCEQLLQQVITLKPKEAAPYYDLSKLAYKINDGDHAIEYIRKAIALDSSNKWYHEQYADVLVLRSDYVAAANEYATIAKTEKYNTQYLEKSAVLYQRAGKMKEALVQLELLKNRDRDNDDVLKQQQQIYLKLNDVENAARVGRELIERNPKEAYYYSMLIDVYEHNDQPEKAKQVLAEMQKKFPSDPSLQLELANQALKKGDTVTYNRYVRQIITNKDLSADVQLQMLGPYLGALATDSMQRAEALNLIEEIAGQHPEDVDVINTYGRILTFNNRLSEAADQYKKAIALNPNSFETWRNLLFLYTRPSDADSLIKWSEKAARLYPQQAMVHYFIGIGNFHKKNFPSAIKAFNRAIDLQPDDRKEDLASMYMALGDLYQVMSDYPRSDSNYEAALKLDPGNATLLNNYAYYLSLRNVRLDEAEKMSRESLRIRPGEGTFLDTYGWILYQQGKYKLALDYIRKAIAANPDEEDPSVWEHLGACEFKAGNKTAAVEAWKKARLKGSDNKNLDKMIQEQKLYE